MLLMDYRQDGSTSNRG